MDKPPKQKIIVILGPTATGKSDLAVLLAKKFNGEVISADSRQVYKGMDIGTGKVTKREMNGVPHHLLDVISPTRTFTAAGYKKMAEKAIKEIVSRGKLPIICGGTGFYIQSVVDDIVLPEVPPNPRLRRKLGNKSAGELFAILRKLDDARAKTIDPKNSRRLLRAIEIATAIGKVPPVLRRPNSGREFLQIGLTLDRNGLSEKIEKRLLRRIKAGMIAEVAHLHRTGVSWKKLNDFGLEYRFVARYLRKEITKQEMTDGLKTAINQYAKRQMTWFKRDKKIAWFKPTATTKITGVVKRFLKD